MKANELEFEEIIKEYGDSLWRITLMYEKEWNSRKDLYQEILLAVWKALPYFEYRSGIKTYLFRIAHNRGITFRERVARRAIFKSLDTSPVAEDSTPEHRIIENEDRDKLIIAISRLPLTLRQVVLLNLEGVSNKEISDILGITENNVAVRLNRAKEKLQKMLMESDK